MPCSVAIFDPDEGNALHIERIIKSIDIKSLVIFKVSDIISGLLQAEFDIFIFDLRSFADEYWEVIGILRSHWKPIRLVAMAVEPSVDLLVKAINSGVTGFVRKPVEEKELLLRIARCGGYNKPGEAASPLYTDQSAGGAMGARSVPLARGRSPGAAVGRSGEWKRKDANASVLPIVRERRVRSKYFPESLFTDACWGMLVDLADSDTRGERVDVSSLCAASGIPQTTALRRIDDLCMARLIRRVPDTADGRRVFIELTEEAKERIRCYAEELSMHRFETNLA